MTYLNIWFSIEIQDGIDRKQRFHTAVKNEKATTTKFGLGKISNIPISTLNEN